MSNRRHNAKGRSEKPDRYVAIYQSMTRTPAWRALTCAERCVYMEIKKRYGGPGTNNGCIPYSLRAFERELHIGKDTASRALDRLMELGFIRQTRKGAFSVKNRMASEWEITEAKNDVTDALPTMLYQRWKPEMQNTVAPENQDGISCETVQSPA